MRGSQGARRIGRLETFLRGMETVLGLHSRLNQLILETFLRGMETRPCCFASVPYSRTLKPSLEGWKRGKLDQDGFRGISLKPSLEGWKHS